MGSCVKMQRSFKLVAGSKTFIYLSGNIAQTAITQQLNVENSLFLNNKDLNISSNLAIYGSSDYDFKTI